MIKFDYTIKDLLGIHARPAGEIAKIAKGLDSSITIFNGTKFASASKLMALMGLGAKNGDTITVTIEGGNEAAAEKAIREFLEANL